jgi:hypothetical protein
MVLNDKCELCNRICHAKRFQQNFKNWTSGNNNIDKFIQDAQLSTHYDMEKALEWIPYDKFYDVKYIAENSYAANWIDGNMIYWSNVSQNWEREGQNMKVELRILGDPENITSELIDEV